MNYYAQQTDIIHFGNTPHARSNTLIYKQSYIEHSYPQRFSLEVEPSPFF